MNFAQLLTIPELNIWRRRAFEASALCLVLSSCIAAGDIVSWNFFEVRGHVYQYAAVGLSAQGFAILGFLLAFFGKGWTRLLFAATGVFEILKFGYLTVFA